jgi:site-specific recombinase XerD
MKWIIKDRVVLSQRLEGPLAAYVSSFAQSLREQGYALYSIYRSILLAACFSRWLGQRAIRRRSVSSEHLRHYLRYRVRQLRPHREDKPSLMHFLEFLRREGVIPVEKAPTCRTTPAEQCAEAFERYLREERGLADPTIVNYVTIIRSFLKDRFGKGTIRLSRLCGGDVVRFVQRQAPRLHVTRAKLLTTALRSFLQYGRYRGDITLDLAAAVPVVAGWSMTSIPRAIPADQLRQLLASVDRSTAIGRRDYAILLLLARLGLRAGEVVSLELDDIDWAAGCLSIRGKSGRETQVPLLAEVGEAIVAYLQHGRPRCTSRHVFLRDDAPIRGFMGSSAIDCIVRRAIDRAGIDTPTKGAHQFRHGLATEMLRHGASLAEIGEVLAHRSPETTKIYAKVDLEALRPLALPWPGGAR